jgi:hypothetical protein
MANRVYWITLVTVLKAAQSYIQRNQNHLFISLTTPQYNCVLDTLTAIISCIQILPSNTPNP